MLNVPEFPPEFPEFPCLRITPFFACSARTFHARPPNGGFSYCTLVHTPTQISEKLDRVGGVAAIRRSRVWRKLARRPRP